MSAFFRQEPNRKCKPIFGCRRGTVFAIGKALHRYNLLTTYKIRSIFRTESRMGMNTGGYRTRKIRIVLQAGFLIFTLITLFVFFFLLTISTPAQSLSSSEQEYKRGLARYNKGDFDGAIAD